MRRSKRMEDMNMNSEELLKAREYEANFSHYISKEERPEFHLTPPIGWMNDPNGFCIYKGRYHLFFQYHPYSTKWGPMHWGHAVSNDLLKWKYLPCALAPDTEYDSGGCFSGSAAELPDGRLLLLYTGNRRESQDDGTIKDVQTQCVAVGDGVDFEKIPQNPVLTEADLPKGGSRYDFRDPKIWREKDGSYACVVGNRTDDTSGSVLLFRSEDGFSWRYDRMIDRSWNEYGKMWECPDFFELDGKSVLIVSPQDMQASGLEFHNGNNIMALIGHSDPETGEFTRERVQSLDYGIDYYAVQTLLLPDGRRIAAAWMQNWDACSPPSDKQRWMGQMALPRELSIKDGRLIQIPVRELEKYRGRCVRHETTVGEETSLPGVFGRTVDMTVSVSPVSDNIYQRFRVKVASGGQHYTLISYRPLTSGLRIDRSHAGFNRDVVHERKCLVRNRQGEIKLRVIIDRFSVEVFVNDGEQVLSASIYTPLTASGISFEAQGQAHIRVEKYDLLSEDGEHND